MVIFGQLMDQKIINHIELEDLLKNIQDALKKYSIKELNNALLDLLNTKSPNKELVDATLKSVSRVFNISQRILISSRARGKLQDARMICYAIMHNELGLTMRYISVNVFKRKTHGSVMQSLSVFKDLKPDKINYHKDLIDKYQKAKELTLNFLILKK